MAEENKTKNVVVETYANDMAGAISGNENGTIKKIIEEEEKNDALEKKTSPESRNNKIFLIIGITLVVLSLGAIFLVYVFREKISTVEVAPQYQPIIFTDKSEIKDISGLKKDEVFNTILNEVSNAEFKSGGIEGVLLSVDQSVVGFRKFLTILEASLEQTQIDFIGDNFMIGAYDRGDNSVPPTRDIFILLKMRSIADVFPPMRTWESKMFYDLHGLFGVNIDSSTSYLLEKNFEDGIVQNKNARILYDKDGKIVLMYIFAEEDSLVIANSIQAAKEVMLRLASSQIKK